MKKLTAGLLIILALVIGALIGGTAIKSHMKREIVTPAKAELICTQQGTKTTLNSLTYKVIQNKKIVAKEVLNYDNGTYTFTSNTFNQKGSLGANPLNHLDLINGYYANTMLIMK